jgi:hypothetical protein
MKNKYINITQNSTLENIVAWIMDVTRNRLFDVDDYQNLLANTPRVYDVPSSSTDLIGTEKIGDIAADEDYLYVVTDDGWRTAPLTNFTPSTPTSSVVMSSGAITTSTNNSNSVWSAVTGSDVTVTAGKTYRIKWKLRTYSASVTTGLGLRRILTTAVGTVYGFHYRGMSNSVVVTARSSREGTNDQFISTGNATSSTTLSGSYEVETLFECTTSGTLGLEMRSEVNLSLTTIDGDGSYWVAEEWDT